MSSTAIAFPNSLTPAPQARITAKVREAIRLMVEEGLKRPDAAEKAGLKDNSLYVAMQKPEVQTYRRTLMEVLRSSEASRTIARAAKLADGAESEHVKLQANTWLAGIEGITPVTKSETVSTYRHLVAGLVIVRRGDVAPGDGARVIEGLAHKPKTHRQINRIGTPVPHPSQRTVAAEPDRAVESGPARAEGGGQK